MRLAFRFQKGFEMGEGTDGTGNLHANRKYQRNEMEHSSGG